MKILGLRSITVKKYNHAGSSKTDNTKEYPNILGQNFNADNPGQKWVGDITYIYIKETECFLKMQYFILIVEANIHQTNLKKFLVIISLNILIVKKVALMIMQVWKVSMPYKKRRSQCK